MDENIKLAMQLARDAINKSPQIYRRPCEVCGHPEWSFTWNGKERDEARYYFTCGFCETYNEFIMPPNVAH